MNCKESSRDNLKEMEDKKVKQNLTFNKKVYKYYLL